MQSTASDHSIGRLARLHIASDEYRNPLRSIKSTTKLSASEYRARGLRITRQESRVRGDRRKNVFVNRKKNTEREREREWIQHVTCQSMSWNSCFYSVSVHRLFDQLSQLFDGRRRIEFSSEEIFIHAIRIARFLSFSFFSIEFLTS